MPASRRILHSHQSERSRAAALAALSLLPDGSEIREILPSDPLEGHPEIAPSLLAFGFERPGEASAAALRRARAAFPRAPVLLLFERASAAELDGLCRLGASGAWSLPLPELSLAAIFSRHLDDGCEECLLPESSLIGHDLLLREKSVSRDLPSAIIDLAQDFATQDPEDLARAESALISLAKSASELCLSELSSRAISLAERSRKSILEGGAPPEVSEALSLLAYANFSLSDPRGSSRAEAEVEMAEERLLFLADPDSARGARLSESLSRIGYPSVVFPTLLSAAAAAAKTPPDALIVDESLCMGCSDSRLDPLRRLPKLMLGGCGEFSSLLKAASVGAVACLERGSDSASVAEALDALFRSSESEPFEILLAESDPALIARLSPLFESAGWRLRVARSGPEAIEALLERPADLALVDLRLPDCPGGTLARVIRLRSEWVGVPIQFLCAPGESHLAREAISHGGDGSVEEAWPDSEILSAVRSACQRSRRLASALAIDGLTGLLLHSHASDAIRRAFAESERSGSPLALAMIDLDRFKSINDRFGHPVGDRVLRTLSSILSRSLRAGDLAGRYGGEEFVILLPDCPLEDALSRVDALRRAFGSVEFESSGLRFSSSFSAGVASSLGFSSHEELIQAADEALYRAKREGRDRVLPFRPDPSESP